MNLLRLFALLLVGVCIARAEPLQIGVAQIDVTPDYPIRLNGFAKRKTESDGASGRIWVKALAFADAKEGPVILITTDNLGIPASIAAEVAARLGKQLNVKPERLTITATHTHSAPMLRGVANPIFGQDLTVEEWDHINRYTEDFTNALEAVALAAIKDVQPAKLEFVSGSVGFAINRRTKGGPTDHALPVLVVRALDGKPRAVWFSYACHCVTLAESKIHGDWAGSAMEEIQKDFPGAVALASIGCGADQNPIARDSIEIASQQGRALADEVKRLLSEAPKAIATSPQTRRAPASLAYEARTRAEWMELLKKGGQLAYYARLNLARIDHGDPLPTHLEYPIQTWTFGEELALVFLPGEVVVDYGLRLKRELRNVIPIAYANDAPGYIPSERILTEGGYEGGGAMVYYDRPNRFAPGLEQKILDVVHAQLPAFRAPNGGGGKGTEGTQPLPPAEAMRALKTKPGLVIELVASEPLVQSPVAIDWGADGRLWVCEMHDYPTGSDENWKPGGRIKVLSDSDGDGRYDRATIFLDGLPFPTGVTAWRNGALICAAPDILFAADENGDGRADRVEKLFSGFATDNYQARVNSLTPGLDGWFYGANGLLGGTIRGGKGGDVQLGKRDFRFRPDTREFEPAGGFTQHGRVRDDWGRWFGCENSLSLYHFPLAEHYLARNPRAAPPGSRVALAAGAGRCFPIAQALPRYNHPESAGRFTAACGVGIYRDALLGPNFRGNAFTCEPAHNLVSRAILTDGPLPSAQRAEDETESEFLASSDVWFRPVQTRTGPDGALYVVDMYRFLIEHPRWIPAERMAKIDARAGADLGRIYRIVPNGAKLGRVSDLSKADSGQLARAFAAANGTERDRIQLRLLEMESRDAAAPILAEHLRSALSPEVRVHALSLLDMLGMLAPEHVASALADAHARVREHGIRLSERFPKIASIQANLAQFAADPDLGARMQLALTLGECEGNAAAAALAQLAASDDVKNPWFRAAVASSAARHPVNLAAAPAPASKKSDAAAMKKLVDQLLTGASSQRGDVLRQYAPALGLNGRAAVGGEIFVQRCAICHRLDNAGHDVGPNLTALRDKPADYWLKNILDPNAVVEPATAGAVLELADGRVLAGVIKGETATSFTLASPGGVIETVLRADVKSRKPAPRSLMPEGIESGLAPQDMADLIAFLRSAPAPAKAGAL